MSTSIPNDRISKILRSQVPKNLRGSDRFLDIITWNIKFFNQRDRKRVRTIRNLMEELNADIFVLQEIEEGALDGIAEDLIESGAGLYKTAYGTTGGEQRVAFMYDTEWVKAASNIDELFPEKPTVEVAGGVKEIFPRLPLHAKFVAFNEKDPFDFELVGVHLKSKRGGGGAQRTQAAKLLAQWVQKAVASEEDIIITGDWNSPEDSVEWKPFKDLETQGKVKFSSLNNDEPSFLSAGGRTSRIDLVGITERTPLIDEKATVIRWRDLKTDNEDVLKQVIDTISDHLPVLTRFYFSDVDLNEKE
jgi:endonuclease/exonuclease/phosphatase family metal-dependent hydrolase